LLPAEYIALGALALTALFWPITAIVRRRFGATVGLAPDSLRAYRFSKIGSILILAAWGLWELTIIRLFKDFDNLSTKYDPNIHFAQVFGILAFLIGAALILWNLRAVYSGARRWPAKVWSIVLTLSAIVMLWIAFLFHLIGFSANY
jgi:hypothetical protein